MRTMTIGAAAVAAAVCWAGGASAQTLEEAALCRSLTNVLIPRLEDSMVQQTAENTPAGQREQVRERLELMQRMRIVADDYIAAHPGEFTQDEIAFIIEGGDVILGARNPIAISERIATCRELFGL